MRVLVSFLLLASAAAASSDVVNRAAALYQRTEYELSLHVLTQDPAPDSVNDLLIGKNYYMLGDYKKATDYFQQALTSSPNKSESELWLGRAWGRRAEAGTPMSLIYAGRTRQSFEKAVALDPHNNEARNDLFDFYLNAPGFLGGGIDKAEAAAKGIVTEQPAEYEFDQAQIAQKRSDFTAAEAHWRRAMELAPGQPGRIVDLAIFLAKRGHTDESDSLFAQARKLAPDNPSVMFAEAKSNIENHRNTDRARQLLRNYLQAALTPDDPPRQEALKLLRRAGG